MSFLLFLASLAFAGEPSTSVADADVSIVAAKEARSAAIEGYRKKLETQKSAAETKLDAAKNWLCGRPHRVAGHAEPLAATNTELKLVPLSDVSPEIAAANAAYRKEHEAQGKLRRQRSPRRQGSPRPTAWSSRRRRRTKEDRCRAQAPRRAGGGRRSWPISSMTTRASGASSAPSSGIDLGDAPTWSARSPLHTSSVRSTSRPSSPPASRTRETTN